MHLSRHSRSFVLAAEPAWFPIRSPRARRVPSRVQTWLAESGSLTARLQATTGSIRVRRLYEGWGRPFLTEARGLKMPWGRLVWVREVCLEGPGGPLLMARSVASAATLTGPGIGVARLGNRPLGAFLFTHPGVERLSMEWARLNDAVCRPYRAEVFPRWGRRALYRIGRDRPLLVNEFFLPAVFALEEDDGLA